MPRYGPPAPGTGYDDGPLPCGPRRGAGRGRGQRPRPALPVRYAWCDTFEEAVRMAREAIAG
ncbi:MAG: hypothetical protein AVDCRST_MAG19-3763 [uncultured Thermomicrobiales bacterium]|uniref:Uncharacterized protein n=1 Tax=uncultured Thermomicrobiales bacterium TaxID=1645740 RepID=A0A6J4VJ10_9BACT|nr:MAG: hypothetical protein AVDCRST_MAG19-3763 [uncultured Thermomicrobiales bacterium]